MLRIDTIESSSGVVLRLQGQLAGPWVDELEMEWGRVQVSAGARPVTLDLAGVTGIDSAARYLLQWMRARNVGVVGACLAIRASLEG